MRGRRLQTYLGIIRSSAVYSLAVFMDRAVSFLMLPVYTRFLNPTDYGVMELLDLALGLIGMLAGVRLGYGLLYYYPAARTEQLQKAYISTAFIGSAAIGILALAAGIAAAPQASLIVFASPAYARHFSILAVSFGCTLPSEIAFTCMRALDRPWSYLRLSAARIGILTLAMVGFVVIGGMGLFGWLFAAAGSGCAVCALAAYQVLSHAGLHFRPGLLKQLFGYSLPLNLSGIGMFLIHFGDRFFLRGSVSLADIGIYGLAYKIGMLVAYVQAPFSIYWTSQMFALVKREDGEAVYVRVSTYFTLCMAFVAVVISLFARPLVQLAVAPAFRGVPVFVPWIAAAYVIRALGEYMRNALLLERRTGLDAWITAAGAAVCLAGYVILIPRFRMWGAVAATGGCFLVLLVLSVWNAQRVRYFAFEWMRMARIAFSAAAVVVASEVIAAEGFWAQMAAGCALTVSFPVLLAATGFLAPDERTALAGMVRAVAGRVEARFADAGAPR